MGLLTTPQREAIEAGNAKYRHVWYIGVKGVDVPFVPVHEVHDDAAGKPRVLDPGQRETEAYNQSLAHPGRMPTGIYSIVCDNSDGRFYETTPNNFWLLGPFQHSPLTCLLRHRVYIMLLDGTWSELVMLQYIGQVTGVDYNEDRREATVTAQALVVAYMNRVWTEDDGVLYDSGLDVESSPGT